MLKVNFPPSIHYLKKKQNELQFFSNLFSIPSNLDAIHQKLSYEEVHQKKLELRSQIKAKFIKNFSPLQSITNLSGEKKIRIGQFNLSYSYQRSGLKLLNRNPFETLYPLAEVSTPVQSYGILTRSGQTATYLALSGLRLLFKKFNLISSDQDVYYETKYLFKLHHLQNHEGPNVYFIDSSTESRKYKNVTENNFQMVIIDTTCYLQGENILNKHVDYFLQKKIPILLLRSHLKLDSLGMEFSLLGSLCLLWHKELTVKEKRNLKRFSKILFELSQIQGGFAGLDQIYPFYHNSYFQEISQRRLLTIKKNTQLLIKLIISAKEKIKSTEDFSWPEMKIFNHQFFFWLIFPYKILPIEFKQLGRALSFQGIPYRFAESFGFDFVTLSVFPHNKKFSTLRISCGDVDKQCFSTFAYTLVQWCWKQGQRSKIYDEKK